MFATQKPTWRHSVNNNSLNRRPINLIFISKHSARRGLVRIFSHLDVAFTENLKNRKNVFIVNMFAVFSEGLMNLDTVKVSFYAF